MDSIPPATLAFLVTMPLFVLAVVTDAALSRGRHRGQYQLEDTVSSLAAAVLYQASGGLTHVFRIGLYAATATLAERWRWPVDRAWAWVAAFLLYDLSYYWQHRCGHTWRLLWASHGVHHSSDRFNLSTALRLPVTMSLWTWVFGLPLALAGVPTVMFAAATAITLLYQFWIHTERVGSLGWFDRWFGSPANHRVHHSTNEPYLDKNFGGFLMLWDRLFGTFAEPLPGEKLTYGLTRPLRSWNFFTVNFGLYGALLRDVRQAPRWRDALAVLFSRTVSSRNADDQGDEAQPDAVPRALGMYALVQVVALLLVNIPLVADQTPHPRWWTPALFAAMAASAWVVSGLLTARRRALGLELARLGVTALTLVVAGSGFALPAVLWAAASAAALVAATARRGTAAASASSTGGRRE